MSEILDLTANVVRFPLPTPFVTARRRSTVAENVRVAVRLADGTRGWGEASPNADVTGETAASVLAAVPEAARVLHRRDVRRVRDWSASLEAALAGQATARSAIEMALLDALARSRREPLYLWFGGALREVRTDRTLPLAPAEEAAALAPAGFAALKIKVGDSDFEADLERVLAAARACPGAKLRLDANQGFDAETALTFVRCCLEAGAPVELLEQPVPRNDREALAAVRRGSPVPVLADEAVLDARGAFELAAMGAVDGFNVKLAKSGLLGALEIVAVARAAGLRLMLGCMLESLLGIGAALHLACGTGAFDYIDLDAHMLLGLESPGRPFVQEGDRLRLRPDLPGIGWEPEAQTAL